MNQKDYQQSYQYIEQFYQNQSRGAEDAFEDMPKSITEESSLFVDERRGLRKDGGKTLAAELAQQEEGYDGMNESQPNRLSLRTGERYDDSMLSNQHLRHHLQADQFEGMGMSIDSQSVSLLEQSLNQGSQARRRRHRKQKEDLDGSRLYRDDQLEEISARQRAPEKKPRAAQEPKTVVQTLNS